ncbi:unnamed protein product [Nezara viridula]|uniref:Uncharacterized protein n=1 Tax=Nezara viridula TaxID=85310 RepID=A0A9P0HGH6_NEZVI|nr:unnamed protein product [Nezara viridula]
MEVRNSQFAAFIDAFTSNTYVLVITFDPKIPSDATLINIRNARRHFEKLEKESQSAAMKIRRVPPPKSAVPGPTKATPGAQVAELTNALQINNRWPSLVSAPAVFGVPDQDLCLFFLFVLSAHWLSNPLKEAALGLTEHLSGLLMTSGDFVSVWRKPNKN